MKIALAQLNYHIANFEENTKKIIHATEQAIQCGAELVIFSELAICGYPPQDLLEQREFIDRCISEIKKLLPYSNQLAIIIGGPGLNPSAKGKRLFNSAYLLHKGKISGIHHKTLLPTYDIFDEYRYFEQNNDFKLGEINGKKCAITICEDLWYEQPVENSFDRNKLYRNAPMKHLSKLQPDFIINIAASPFSYTQEITRKEVLHRNARKYQKPVIYLNQVGAHSELIFDGGSMIINSEGQLVHQLKHFEEDFYVFDPESAAKPSIPTIISFEDDYSVTGRIYQALVLGVRDFFRKMNFKSAIIGLSGGIDSAVTLIIMSEALGHENVHVLLMPSKYSSEHSVKDAVELADNLQINYDIIHIQDIVDSFSGALMPVFDNNMTGITEENIQARVRGVLLMAYSNNYGHILLNTSNKSEAAVGYGTLYGDMNGSLSVLGDVYKTRVYKLAEFINKDKEKIPQHIISKPPSAELRPDQKDTDSLPDYASLDTILHHYIELKKGETEITNMGFDKSLVKKIISLVNRNEFKRYQTPPMLRISTKGFGMGRRMPLVAKY